MIELSHGRSDVARAWRKLGRCARAPGVVVGAAANDTTNNAADVFASAALGVMVGESERRVVGFEIEL